MSIPILINDKFRALFKKLRNHVSLDSFSRQYYVDFLKLRFFIIQFSSDFIDIDFPCSLCEFSFLLQTFILILS